MILSLNTWQIRSLQITSLLILCVTFASVALGQAQSAAADLQGSIKDSTGAVVPNATVTARNAATNVSRTGNSNDEGFYRIINVPPGDYQITVEATNFKKAVLTKVTLTAAIFGASPSVMYRKRVIPEGPVGPCGPGSP